MRQIEGLTNDPKQQFFAVIEGYDVATITLEFKPNQYSWFISVQWGTFAINNELVSCSPNLLRQFRNMIPFGIGIYGVNQIDPISIDSWITTNQFFILDKNDIQDIEGIYASLL